MSPQGPKTLKVIIEEAVQAVGRDPGRLLDIALDVQKNFGCVNAEAATSIATALGIQPVEVEGVVSFYAFLSEEPAGHITIRLCDDVVDRMSGFDEVAAAFEDALGIRVGEVTDDDRFGLVTTPCIGMCDQAPAALIGDVVVTNIEPAQVAAMIKMLKVHNRPRRLVQRLGDGANAHARVNAMVTNNLRHTSDMLFSPELRGEALQKAFAISPIEVIRLVKAARLRGRGGAGFPTGMKWEFTRAAEGDKKVVICNADEGEPGTFKDRVLLTERPNRVLAGLTIAGYAVGASEGILYLRAEYAYLKPYLEDVIERRREDGLLGKNIGLGFGHNRDFDFDIRIQMGAGAYICGEESALIESCEGKRGDPRNRPPFPAQSGYKGRPTSVNNVETLCCVTKILHWGAATFCAHGTVQSSGTKLLSISGDVGLPGVFEVDFGTTLRAVLDLTQGDDAAAVLVGGPSGKLIGPADFDRTICFDDLATGGAIVVFNAARDLLEVASQYMDFFIEESCGYCTPCRAGNVLLAQSLAKIRSGVATPSDAQELRALGETVKRFSRCGLGQTSPNPILSILDSFPDLIEEKTHPDESGVRRSFDLEEQLSISHHLVGKSGHDAEEKL